MTFSANKQLAGLNILVTRPIHQSTVLAASIRSLGGNPIVFPTLEIVDLADLSLLFGVIDRLSEFDWAIFVSPNAVNKAMPVITGRCALPAHMKIAAVGKGTADTLIQYGVSEVLIPKDKFDSEALLECAEFDDMTGKRVVIFRGFGGRQLLGDTLKQRGAIVEYAECYIRKKPEIDTASLISDWSQGRLHAVIVTSSEGLHNLFDIIGELGQQLLKVTPIITTHERIAQAARKMGLEKVVKAPSPGDAGVLESIQAYFQPTGK
ncbi:uroporphyrinogen-III synthase [Nitrosomonas sp.]|uniref:uroporphyrinogen-III synthase n=1 Tax=Nitrosomonas sp. TaxID=42353 RepID=UPI001D891153|nr:uroporphyrinogen-III synthase [Nitrosomonas sp.]MBX3617525.1 uroporphyrinogen-III synthase [Nitrosomonas sp.]